MNRASSKPHRRWFSFSLRTFVIASTLLSILLGLGGSWLVQIRARQAFYVRLGRLGGRIGYQATATGTFDWLLGEHAFSSLDGFSWEPPDKNHDISWLAENDEIRFVDLTGQNVTDSDLAVIAQLSHLKRLQLEDVRLSGDALRTLGQSKSLQQLDLRRAAAGQDFAAGLGSLQRLEVLHIYNYGLRIKDLAELDKLQQLTSLGFWDTSQLDDRLFEQVSKLASLRELVVTRAPIRGTELHRLQGLPLEALFLNECPLEDSACADFPQLPNLSWLTLNSSGVGDETAEVIARLPQLEILHLTRTRLSDRGLAAIAQSTTLRQLDIVGTYVTPDGLMALGQTRQLKRLGVGPGIRESQARQLKEQLSNCAITAMDGKDNELFRIH